MSRISSISISLGIITVGTSHSSKRVQFNHCCNDGERKGADDYRVWSSLPAAAAVLLVMIACSLVSSSNAHFGNMICTATAAAEFCFQAGQPTTTTPAQWRHSRVHNRANASSSTFLHSRLFLPHHVLFFFLFSFYTFSWPFDVI